MNKVCFVFLFCFISSCSWVSVDYWKVRSVIKDYQQNLYELKFNQAGNFLTNKSRIILLEKLKKEYSDKDLINYKKLSALSFFEFQSIVFKENIAEVVLVENVPDFELIFGTIISWHINKEKDGGSAISLELLIDRFIDEIVSADPSLFLITQQTTYQLVKDNGKWFVNLE